MYGVKIQIGKHFYLTKLTEARSIKLSQIQLIVIFYINYATVCNTIKNFTTTISWNCACRHFQFENFLITNYSLNIQS